MFAVVYVPDFFLQAALRPTPELCDRAVALVDAQSAKITVAQATLSARRQGVTAGLTPSQASARCPQLIIKNRNTAQEQSAVEILLQSAFAFSPSIESTAPGVCTMDLNGLRLENEIAAREWAMKFLRLLRQLNLEAQIGFGPNPGLAWLVAQAAKQVLWLENPREFVSNLPVAALHPPLEILEVLDLWGIRTIGAFSALGRDKIAARLGPGAVDLIDAIESRRPLKLVSPSETFVERMDFEREIETAAPLLFLLNRFVEQLATRLDAIYKVVAELHLQLTLASGARYERVFKIPSPTNKLQVLFRMLQTHLENVRTDSPIMALELRAVPGKAGRHQFGLFDATLRDPNQFAETLARLTALCGPENVGSPQLAASHRPDTFRMVAPAFAECKPPAHADAPPTNSFQQGPQLRRFRPPVPARLEFRGQQPALVFSRPCNSTITAAHGPFASSGDWWEQNRSWARDEWDVQTGDGRLYRIFRTATGCFVEGVYD